MKTLLRQELTKNSGPKNSVDNESEIEGYFGEATTSSTTLEELSPQNSTENDAEVEGAVGGAATLSTALEDHASILTQCRQDAREGQEKSRAEMLRTTRAKLVPLMETMACWFQSASLIVGALIAETCLGWS